MMLCSSPSLAPPAVELDPLGAMTMAYVWQNATGAPGEVLHLRRCRKMESESTKGQPKGTSKSTQGTQR